MKNIKISIDTMNAIKASHTAQAAWEAFCDSVEYASARADGFPFLHGGLDRISVTYSQVVFHDRGLSSGGKILDGTFKVSI